MQSRAQPAESCDVLIMGGGLAGLTLALQLRQRFPAMHILVLERRSHPVPEAAHKVGESTVELGAHYFAEVLGLRRHFEQRQIKKFGFRFFFSEGRRDIDQVTEIGASRLLAVPSYQIDRGIFENFLGEEAQSRGIRFSDAARVTRLTLAEGQALHQVEWRRGDEAHHVQARWVIDACGRAGLIKGKLGLAQPNDHGCHAIWFRIAERIKIDDWCGDPAWQNLCTPPERWRSTNHLVGAGYWAWLIPLSSGSHSVGIVADPRHHALETMNSFDKAMDWFKTWQPRLYDALDGQRDKLQDFAFFKHFSYGCKQVFSGQRWALTGEAGLFLDPFYSPGSDFIAIANTFITDLIARDQAGQAVDAHAGIYDQLYHSFYESTLAMYQDQYALFGEPEVLPVKVIWDYSYYWGVLSQLFVHQRLTDLRTLSALKDELARCQHLNVEVQALLRAWGQLSAKRNPAQMLDQASLPWFAELNASLADTLDEAGFRARMRRNAVMLTELADEIVERATALHPALDAAALRAVIGSAPQAAEPRVRRLFETTPA
ncbi:NAD(P)/FAD-dependent oxidoreductase [Aquabacterium sp.]|uniref:NAD(P)/FAD-dependent oxidoreductase n=1 Tax=Aquabacterium sp. TaxID=1872578 RepID=UPI002C0F8B63|nr:NAD(P)/FAD-dependent oxidoreductase [Aquabacterium sp.]HSW03458.1 NAD(P)/FAD-dependent oxidoreductase [Aquabacterium sp.]